MDENTDTAGLETAHNRALEWIGAMLRTATSKEPQFPPTLLYNEGWLLRLVLDWFARSGTPDHRLSFADGARWFSEARLPSAFLPQHRGDKLAESRTNADGVAGHIVVGEDGKSDLKLEPGCQQFYVAEAKIFSGLSKGVTHASWYDQAARNVACIAEVLRRANRHPDDVARLGFFVIAPRSRIDRGVFIGPMEKSSIRKKVERRTNTYGGEKDEWFNQWFLPTWNRLDVDCLSWEALISDIGEQDSAAGEGIERFYEVCLRMN